MIVYCCNCGKRCSTRPCKVERGQVNPARYFCRECNKHFHRVVRHPDMSPQRKLKELRSMCVCKSKE